MYVLYNPDGVVKYSVIHRLQLINSEIPVNVFSDHVMPLCLSLMHALAGSVDPGNSRNIFNVAK